MSRISTKRLTKELMELRTSGPPTGCALLQCDDLETWLISISVLGDETVYAGEVFCLKFKFSSSYPIDSPEVTFLTSNGFSAPIHPHIYSVGHICLSILSGGWSPVLNVSALLISIQSMLASCKKKELPPDNDRYCASAPKNPKLTKWSFHDDTV